MHLLEDVKQNYQHRAVSALMAFSAYACFRALYTVPQTSKLPLAKNDSAACERRRSENERRYSDDQAVPCMHHL